MQKINRTTQQGPLNVLEEGAAIEGWLLLLAPKSVAPFTILRTSKNAILHVLPESNYHKSTLIVAKRNRKSEYMLSRKRLGTHPEVNLKSSTFAAAARQNYLFGRAI
jgi:hypothetical protein